jgi:hypothetical protein
MPGMEAHPSVGEFVNPFALQPGTQKQHAEVIGYRLGDIEEVLFHAIGNDADPVGLQASNVHQVVTIGLIEDDYMRSEAHGQASLAQQGRCHR